VGNTEAEYFASAARLDLCVAEGKKTHNKKTLGLAGKIPVPRTSLRRLTVVSNILSTAHHVGFQAGETAAQ